MQPPLVPFFYYALRRSLPVVRAGLSKPAHPDAARLDNREMTVPIVARRDPGGKAACCLIGTWRRNSKKHDPAAGRQCRPRGQLAKILVERQKNPMFAHSRRQHIGIGRTRCREPHPNNVVSGRFERRHRGARKILVSQKPQLSHAALGNTFSEFKTSRA